MKLSLFGRSALALFATLTLALGITGCNGGTVAFMWVLGQQYNQIAGFKVDNYTGNLTQIPNQPFSSGGVNPVHLVVKPGGRYVYVLNQGTPVSGQETTAHYTSGNISVFSVGGDGILTFQQSYVSQGYDSQWMQMSSDGSFLYVLDKYSPSGDGNSAITTYSADASTGRLTLVTNTQGCVGTNCPTYTEIAGLPNAFQLRQAGSCLFATNTTTIVPYTFSTGGQLAPVTNGSVTLSGITTTPNITSISGNSGFLTVTDSANNSLTLYQIGTGCALTVAGGGPQSLAQYGTTNPAYSIIDSTGKYVLVANQFTTSTTVTTPYSSILSFFIQPTNNELTLQGQIRTGSNPVCMAEDSSGQYIYTSNHNDGTVSGFVFDNTTGTLAQLKRGSTFTATGESECMAVSGFVD